MQSFMDITDPSNTPDNWDYCIVLISARNNHKPDYTCVGAFDPTYSQDITTRLVDDCELCVSNYMCSFVETAFEDDWIQSLLFTICSMLSGFFLTAVGMFILMNKKFNKHPYPVIAIACLLNGCNFAFRYSNYQICKWKEYSLLVETTWPINSLLGLRYKQ